MTLKATAAFIATTVLMVAAILALSIIGGMAAEHRCGTASWYGFEHHGRRTASGEVFDQWGMTAAAPSRKYLGERWRVTYRGKSVVVRITDTGGFAKYGRIIDLSRGAATKLGMINAGVGKVCVERI